MTLLLDTHVLLWWFFDDPRLSTAARTAIADRTNTIYVSSASAWEIAIKFRLGRLPEATEAVHQLPELLSLAGFNTLSIEVTHAVAAGLLNAQHRDPFDRMLMAQAAVDGLTLVTQDTAITDAFANTLW